jgi:hypothetical protein
MVRRVRAEGGGLSDLEGEGEDRLNLLEDLCGEGERWYGSR